MTYDARTTPTPASTPLVSYIAVDPGRQTGWAMFAPYGRLVRCGVSKPPFYDIPRGDPLLVIERPHGGEGKASRKDLVTLTMRMGDVVTHLGAKRVLAYEPRRWKGTIRKEIMTRRIVDYWMSPEEREILGKRKNHNMIDAVGLGIWYAAVLGLRVLP